MRAFCFIGVHHQRPIIEYSGAMSPRRNSPHRRVLEISRIGSWGNIRYLHTLECGHNEVLKRASRSELIACSSCGKPNIEQPMNSVDFSHLLPSTILDFSEHASQDEIEVKKLQAHLASILGIPAEAISIISSDAGGRLVVKSAYIFLSSSDIRSIIERFQDDDK